LLTVVFLLQQNFFLDIGEDEGKKFPHLLCARPILAGGQLWLLHFRRCH